MSIAYGSGGRHRPVDVSADDGDEVPIDGTRLKQLRVERGLTVSEAARQVTLSREQVEQIENGGLGAFYGARHKLLAVRKYAEGFGLALEDLLPKAPPSAPLPEAATPDEPLIPATAAEETAAADQLTTEAAPEVIEATAPAPVDPRIFEVPVAPVPRTVREDEPGPASELSRQTVRRLPLLLVVGASLILVFSILRGLTPVPEPAEVRPPEPVVDTATETPTESSSSPAGTTEQPAPPQATATTEAAAPLTTAAATPAVTAAPEPPSAMISETQVKTPERELPASDPCALIAGPDTPRWAPTQARNSSTRVFVTSNTPVDVCVTDASGVATPLKVKPGAMSSVSGKPPYTVRSERLSQAQIFFQGLKVRAPSSAVSVHLFATSSVRSPESANPGE